MKKLISQFNHPQVHLVVSQWPEIHTGKSYHGVAAFTRETLMTLAKNQGMRFVVLAETNGDNRPQVVANGKILVLRVFDHKHPSLYPVILTWLAKFYLIKRVTVHSEFGASAGLKHFILLLPFLGLIKLTKRKITFFAHNVVEKIDYLAPHLNLDQPFKMSFINAGIKLYYQILGSLVNDLITLDKSGYESLSKYVMKNKLKFFPHWVKSRSTRWTKNMAKRELGIDPETKVILAFGFISNYKGSDIITKLFGQKIRSDKKYQLILAGGKAPSLEKNLYYQKYYSDLASFINEQRNINLTGFVSESKIGLYFAAADLVVLPYRGLMGGSGALAYAMGYHKPFLISTRMKSLWKNEDLAQALSSLKMGQEEIMFSLDSNGMKKIMTTLNQPKQLRRLTKLSQDICLLRNIESICNSLYNQIYRKPDTVSFEMKSYGQLVSPA